ncbi:23S rRNA (pseudouridine(1915)-N(3))-methyltransferase RlmH [Kiritimatiellota bacterium B12222]|nr:23S rRNA (pseudouridine(1915)-N(3))-methyltransferase RlmH [Kiritimatiellota bacterium B12222]
MKWKIISVGKPSFPWVREGLETYLKRVQPFAPVEMIQLKKGDAAAFNKVIGSAKVMALDERGKSFRTGALAQQVTEWELDSVREMAVLIGGSDGLPAEIRNQAHHCFSLGAQTLMHELALLVWMEQLYRIYTLKADHPYHRE